MAQCRAALDFGYLLLSMAAWSEIPEPGSCCGDAQPRPSALTKVGNVRQRGWGDACLFRHTRSL